MKVKIDMMVNGKMAKEKEKEFITMLMEISILENGKMENSMV